MTERQHRGYRVISIRVSEREYERLLSARSLTAAGTVEAAFRTKAGLQEMAHGLKKLLTDNTRFIIKETTNS